MKSIQSRKLKSHDIRSGFAVAPNEGVKLAKPIELFRRDAVTAKSKSINKRLTK